MIPFELMVEEQPGTWHYRVCWCDGEPDSAFLTNIPESYLDLILPPVNAPGAFSIWGFSYQQRKETRTPDLDRKGVTNVRLSAKF